MPPDYVGRLSFIDCVLQKSGKVWHDAKRKFLGKEVHVHTTTTPQQRDAITAAFQRLRADLTGRQLDVEVAWALCELRLARDGSINWRGMRIGKMLFLALAEAQNWKCCHCGCRTDGMGPQAPTLEHVVPKSVGGADHPDNLAMACFACNSGRAGKLA